MFTKLITCLALTAGLALAFSAPAAAAWPDRPVKVIVPYAAGGPVDLVSRIIAEKLSAKFGQNFVIDNKPGANGAIGVQAVMNSPVDGYTLLMHGSAGVTIYQAVMRQPAFDTLRDLTPISMAAYFDLILCANPALPLTDLRSFVDYAKRNPDKLSYGSASVGAMNHIGTEWFKSMVGIDMVHVPYRGDAPVAADLTAGTIGVAFVSSNVAIPLIKAGKLRALAVPSVKRLPTLPDVPTMAEAGYPDFDLRPWTGFFGPAKLDNAIVVDLERALKEILTEREVVEKLAALGMQAAPSTEQELAQIVKSNIALWKDVAAKAKIVVE